VPAPDDKLEDPEGLEGLVFDGLQHQRREAIADRDEPLVVRVVSDAEHEGTRLLMG